MKKIFIPLVTFMLFANTTFAEVTRHYNHEMQTYSIVSNLVETYENMKLSFSFEKEFRSKSDLKDVSYALLIQFDPFEQTREYHFFKDGFAYYTEDSAILRKGAFSSVTDPGIGRSTYRQNVTIRENSPGNYTVTSQGETFRYGGSFFITYSKDKEFLRKYKTHGPELSFYDDLMKAINSNKELTIQVPYTNNLNDVDKIDFVVFTLSKSILKEWNDVASAKPIVQ